MERLTDFSTSELKDIVMCVKMRLQNPHSIMSDEERENLKLWEVQLMNAYIAVDRRERVLMN